MLADIQKTQKATISIYIDFDVPLDIVAPESLAVFFFQNAGNDALIEDYCKSNKNRSLNARRKCSTY